MTEQATHHVEAKPVPVSLDQPVSVGHDINVQGQAADFGSWATYVTPAGADVARSVLQLDRQRHRATILVSAPGAVVAGSGVWVGTVAQCQASPPIGGFLAAGASVVIENNQPLWMVGDGTNSLRVTVLQERWDNSPGHPEN